MDLKRNKWIKTGNGLGEKLSWSIKLALTQIEAFD